MYSAHNTQNETKKEGKEINVFFSNFLIRLELLHLHILRVQHVHYSNNELHGNYIQVGH